jgi:pyruvate/2-oxoglutarate dehydrogenase complex dihydrolipoamide dehydrogenase (E3) component
MGFEKAGIEFSVAEGVKVNDHLMTTNKHVFAAGDCCSKV